MQTLSSWIFSFDGVFTLLAITLVSILLFSVWVGYMAHRLNKEQAKNHPPKKNQIQHIKFEITSGAEAPYLDICTIDIDLTTKQGASVPYSTVKSALLTRTLVIKAPDAVKKFIDGGRNNRSLFGAAGGIVRFGIVSSL